jgi:hypothetical protein
MVFFLNRQTFDKLFSTVSPEGLFSPEKKMKIQNKKNLLLFLK